MASTPVISHTSMDQTTDTSLVAQSEITGIPETELGETTGPPNFTPGPNSKSGRNQLTAQKQTSMSRLKLSQTFLKGQ